MCRNGENQLCRQKWIETVMCIMCSVTSILKKEKICWFESSLVLPGNFWAINKHYVHWVLLEFMLYDTVFNVHCLRSLDEGES